MRRLRLFAGIIGAIVLGAIGSGLWDLFLKRAVLWFWNVSGTVAGWLFSSFRNVPYQQAAHSSPQDTLFYLAMIIACMWLGRELGRIDPPWIIPENASYAEKQAILRRWRKAARPLVVSSFVFFSIQIGEARATYRIIDDFTRNIEVVASIADAKAVADFRYGFSQMRSRADYVALTARMALTARSAGFELPRP